MPYNWDKECRVNGKYRPLTLYTINKILFEEYFEEIWIWEVFQLVFKFYLLGYKFYLLKRQTYLEFICTCSCDDLEFIILDYTT